MISVGLFGQPIHACYAQNIQYTDGSFMYPVDQSNIESDGVNQKFE